MTVNGVNFPIQEPWPFVQEKNKQWYSHKFKSVGLQYEIGICNKTGDIVWLNGPFPCGSCPDLEIFCLGLKNKLGPGEKVIADRGYRGICTFAYLTMQTILNISVLWASSEQDMRL